MRNWRSMFSHPKCAGIWGGLLVELGGADAIVFTGGIGENGVAIRHAVCDNLQSLGILLDDPIAIAPPKAKPRFTPTTAARSFG